MEKTLFLTGVGLADFPSRNRLHQLHFSDSPHLITTTTTTTLIPSSNPPTTKHQPLSRYNTAPTHFQNALYLLDVSLARDHIDSSSAASARKSPSLLLSLSRSIKSSTSNTHHCLRSNPPEQIGLCHFRDTRGIKFLVVSSPSLQSPPQGRLLLQYTRAQSPHASTSFDNAHQSTPTTYTIQIALIRTNLVSGPLKLQR